MARRRSRGGDSAIWPGFVDGLSTLLLVMMFLLSIFVVAQFYLGQELQSKNTKLASLQDQLSELARQLSLAESDKEKIRARMIVLEESIQKKDDQLAAAAVAATAAAAAIAGSAADLEAEKALSEEQKSELATLNAQLNALRAQLASLQEALEAAEALDKEQNAQIENLSARLNAALARKVQELAEVRSRFFEALRKALGDRTDVKVVGDRFVFESDILFGSCSATISDAGRTELQKLANVLLDIQGDIPSEVNWVLRVDGHADRSRLGAACSAKFDDNLDLSSERAQSVVRSLKSAGVPAKRLVAAGWGAEQPIVAGSSALALAQNRRIEFKLTDR